MFNLEECSPDLAKRFLGMMNFFGTICLNLQYLLLSMMQEEIVKKGEEVANNSDLKPEELIKNREEMRRLQEEVLPLI